MLPKKLINKFMEQLWNQKDTAILDQFFTNKTLIHSPLISTQGVSEMKNIVQNWLQAFPDLHCDWEDFISEDNKIMVRWRAQGTHLGKFLDYPPTTKNIHYAGVSIYQLHEQKIIEYWGLVDMYGLLNQITSSTRS